MSPPGPARRIQLGEPDALLVELEPWEDLDASRRLERIADEEIVLLLQLTRFDRATSEWQTVARALAEYGFAVFTGWGVAGALRRVAANHAGGRGVIGLGKIPEGIRLTFDEAQSLAGDVVAIAIESFRTKTLMDPRRTWRPAGGASLKTYFIGRALMELPDGYRRWASENRSPMIDLRETIVDDGRHSDDPSHAAIVSDTLAEIASVDPEAVTMVALQDHGYTLEEIAEMLETTEGAVRTKISRLRARTRKQYR